MNTLDLYEFEINKPPTPAPPVEEPSEGNATSSSAATSAAAASEPTLNEEVNQALGQLGRFWGGFRASVSLISISVVLSCGLCLPC